MTRPLSRNQEYLNIMGIFVKRENILQLPPMMVVIWAALDYCETFADYKWAENFGWEWYLNKIPEYDEKEDRWEVSICAKGVSLNNPEECLVDNCNFIVLLNKPHFQIWEV